jgi:hypothetical protein
VNITKIECPATFLEWSLKTIREGREFQFAVEAQDDGKAGARNFPNPDRFPSRKAQKAKFQELYSLFVFFGKEVLKENSKYFSTPFRAFGFH